MCLINKGRTYGKSIKSYIILNNTDRNIGGSVIYSIAYFSCSTDHILHIDKKKKTESRCVDENNRIFNLYLCGCISHSEFSNCSDDGSTCSVWGIRTCKIVK